jgi:mono/diheme cytochrome c family protein
MKSPLILTGSLVIASTLSALGAEAKANWDTHCLQCHGKEGHGDTKMGKLLQAMDLTDAKKQAAFTDAAAEKAIKEGIKEGSKTKMKAFGDKLSDDEVKALVAHVRTLKK